MIHTLVNLIFYIKKIAGYVPPSQLPKGKQMFLSNKNSSIFEGAGQW